MPDTEEKTTPTQTAKVETTPIAEGKKEGSKLPEKDYFSGDAMNKFAEEIDLFKDAPKAEAKVEPKEETKPAKEKPCADCDDDGREPIDHYVHNGEKINIYTEDQRRELMQKGHDYDHKRGRDAEDRREWETSFNQREASLEKIGTSLEQIMALNKGQETQGEEEIDPALAAIDDPAVADALKAIQRENQELKSALSGVRNETRVTKMKEVGEQLDQIYGTTREEFPFEQVVDDDGNNITEKAFAGLISVKVNLDTERAKKDKTFKMKDMTHYMRETAKDMHVMEKTIRAASNSGQEITAESVIQDHVDVAKEIGQIAVANYLKQQEGNVPVARAESTDATRERPSDDGKPKSLDEYLEAAVRDPEIGPELDKMKI